MFTHIFIVSQAILCVHKEGFSCGIFSLPEGHISCVDLLVLNSSSSCRPEKVFLSILFLERDFCWV